MKFFHVYNDRAIGGLEKNGLINSESGFKMQHVFSVPLDMQFNSYAKKDGKLWNEKPAFTPNNMFNDEIAGFVRCVRSGEKLPSHIDKNILTSRLMQGIYDSSEAGHEVVMG